MHRFYLPADTFSGDYVSSSDKGLILQITKVLLAKEGDRFWLFDGLGYEYLGQIIELSNSRVRFLLIDKKQSTHEPASQITLYQSLLKSDKLEWVMQKAAELGVKEIVPVISSRSIVRQITSVKLERYQEILKEATEQCGGAIMPKLSLAIDFREAIKLAAKADGLKFIAWEKETSRPIETAEKINIFIGPEGGFSEEEIDLAKNNGIEPVTLGKRILRAETAAIASLAKLLL